MRKSIVAHAVALALVLLCPRVANALVGDGIAASVPPFTKVATNLGPAPPLQLVRLVLHLPYPRPGAVEEFVRAVNDPSSRMFGAFLSPTQFTTQFGPTPHSYTQVEYIVVGLGLNVIGVSGNLKELDVTAPVAVVDLAFGTTINQYNYNGVTYYANATPAYIPALLKGLMMAASGFTDFSLKVGQPPGSSLSGYGPLDIERAYNEPIRKRPALNGSGVTIAIDTAYDYLDSDLQGYWNAFGIKRTGTVSRIPVTDPINQGLGGGSNEATLDVEQVTSSAPGANVEVYEASDTLNTTFEDMYTQTVDDPNVDVVTTSFGQCEVGADPNIVVAENDLFEQGAAEGQTWFAASGDLGSHDCGQNDPPYGFPGYPNPNTVDFPASSPYVTAAGGTTLKLRPNRTIASETAWSGSGGGSSKFFRRPWYQKWVQTLANRHARNVPDVALDADPNTPYALYYLGTFLLSAGGTSAVAPNLAAMQAQFDQFYGGRLGQAQTGLYDAFRYGRYPGEAFHDITRGCNGKFCAGIGYDNVTGVGSLDALQYMLQLPEGKSGRRP